MPSSYFPKNSWLGDPVNHRKYLFLLYLRLMLRRFSRWIWLNTCSGRLFLSGKWSQWTDPLETTTVTGRPWFFC